MCFSSTASFTASAVLSVAGVYTFAQSRTFAQRALSGVPLLFAAQQFTEGILWLSLTHDGWQHWEKTTTYGFLFFAQVLWPVYVPLCMLLLESDTLKKKIISLLLLAGICLSTYITYCLYNYPVQAIAEQHHIRYQLGFALATKWYYGILYFLPTIVAPIISSVKKAKWLGYLFFISYLFARLLFHYFEISVWCFFGAIISLLILKIITDIKKELA